MKKIIYILFLLTWVVQSQKIQVLNNQVTPQDFGYVSNDNPKQFYNDATEYIQACLDSDYSVYIPSGYYYITKPLKVRSGKAIKMVGSYSRDREKYRKDTIYKKESTVIYTDKNTDFWHIYSSNVRFENGTMLVENVENPSAIVFTYFFKDNLIQSGGLYGVTITGGETNLKGNGLGYIGVSFNSTKNTNGYRPNMGECHYLEFDIKASYLKTVFIASSNDNKIKRSCSVFNINIESFSCKQSIVLDGYGTSSKITGWNHGRYILTEKEKHLSSLYLNTSMCDVDFTLLEQGSKTPNKYGYYMNYTAIENFGGFNFLLGNRWHWNLRYNRIIENQKFVNSDFYRTIYNLK